MSSFQFGMLDLSTAGCLTRVISGGQIGADVAGLMAAKAVGLETGGTAPRTFRIHGGTNPELGTVYGLVEHLDFGYRPRTIQNVMNSDATIIIAKNLASPGCLLTSRTAVQRKKPLLEIEVPYTEIEDYEPYIQRVIGFLEKHHVKCVNIAGNRDHEGNGFSLEHTVMEILIPAFMEVQYVPE